MFLRLDEAHRIFEEERCRTQAFWRSRRARRRRLLMWWLALLGLAAAMILGGGGAHAQGADTALDQRLRELEARVAHLEADRERLSRVLLTFRVPASFTFAGEQVPLDRWDVHERLEREVLLSLQDRGQVVLWLKRAARYFPYIERLLAQDGLPDDLKYVAVIESALLPLALSQANATGIWQFVPATARRYGLRVTPWWDERKDPELATRAALAYLKGLQAEFGRWSLALAAYNCGEARVRSAIKAQGVQSYFQLALPAETERYVFRAYAAKLILAEPERYGFLVPETERYQPPARDRIRLHVRTRLPVRAIAEASGSFYREVKQLNPAITRDALPAGVYALNLPEGAGESFRPREARAPRARATGLTHRVRPGDTLSAIARQYGMSLALLRQRNPALRGGLIHPGDVLVVR
jgi:murein DD-endopeptidase MepM/ murein hydrolase activator NlpD